MTRSTRWLVPVVLVSVVSPFATDAYLPALPRLQVDLGVSPALVQTTLAAFVIAFAAGQLLGGAVSDRHGRRAVVITGSVVFAVGSVVCAVADGVPLFDAARAVEGLGAGAAVAAARGVVVDRSEDAALARRLGLLFTALVLAPICAPSFGSVVVSLSGWRTIFLVLAALGLVMAVLTVRFVPREERGTTKDVVGVLAGFRSLARAHEFRRWLAASCCSAVAGFCYVTFSPFVLQ